MKKNLETLWKSFKKVKPSKILILIFLLIFNAFAWFIYATEVSSGISAKVKSWKIVFSDGENEIVNYIDFDVNYMYPGMPNYSRSITVYNKSDVSAHISFEVMSARIFEDEFITKEGYEKNGDEVPDDALSSSELISKLKNDYPFTISMSSIEAILGEESSATYGFNVVWPFEGDDSVDTVYGEKAASFHEENPDLPSITLNIRIKAIQQN